MGRATPAVGAALLFGAPPIIGLGDTPMESGSAGERGPGRPIRHGLILLGVAGIVAVGGWLLLAPAVSSAFLSVLAGLAIPATPEPTHVPRIGYLGSLGRDWPAPLGRPRVDVFRDGLREQGYIEGRNIFVETRFADGDFPRMPELAAELANLQVDVIVLGDSRGIRFARDATSTIPLVMTLSSDPVGSGFAASLYQPGGNITGLTMSTMAVDGKRLELLKEMVPRMKRVAILWEQNEIAGLEWAAARAAAQTLDLELFSFEVGSEQDVDEAMKDMAEGGVHGIFVFGSPSLAVWSPTIAALARQHSLPLAGSNVESVQAGALMTYVPDYPDLYRRAAVQVRRILHGADPANLPIEQPSRFDLVVNLATAEALGLDIPRSIRLRATDVVR